MANGTIGGGEHVSGLRPESHDLSDLLHLPDIQKQNPTNPMKSAIISQGVRMSGSRLTIMSWNSFVTGSAFRH